MEGAGTGCADISVILTLRELSQAELSQLSSTVESRKCEKKKAERANLPTTQRFIRGVVG